MKNGKIAGMIVSVESFNPFINPSFTDSLYINSKAVHIRKNNKAIFERIQLFRFFFSFNSVIFHDSKHTFY